MRIEKITTNEGLVFYVGFRHGEQVSIGETIGECVARYYKSLSDQND